MPKYPDINVQLSGRDGNAFAILGAVQRALRDAGISQDTIAEFFAEAKSGGYHELIQTVMRWVKVS